MVSFSNLLLVSFSSTKLAMSGLTETYLGLWGLAGYPLEGMHKSLRNSLSKSKTKDILASRMQQGIEEMCAATTQERSAVIQKWHDLQRAGLGHMSEREHEHGHHGS